MRMSEETYLLNHFKFKTNENGSLARSVFLLFSAKTKINSQLILVQFGDN